MAPHWILLCGIVVVVGGILAIRLHAFLALIMGALVVAALTGPMQLSEYAASKKMSEKETAKLQGMASIERVATEFGVTCGKIGILIALASIVGKCLMDSGAADRIVRTVSRVLGEKRTPVGFFASGYLLGIPVFFDTVFLLMVPLAKAMWMRTRRNYALYIMAIIAGGSMTHSLVPPTPGPLAVAVALKVDMGTMILMGCIVGLLAAIPGMVYAWWLDARLNLPVRESGQTSLVELEKISQRDESSLPPLWLALAPILLPVFFIGGGTVVESLYKPAEIAALQGAEKHLVDAFKFLGNATIALGVAAALALLAYVWKSKPTSKEMSDAMGAAMADGGQILLLTAAGGAFGGVLQHTGIGGEIEHALKGAQGMILPAAFLVTVLIRAAQGSATVAMLTVGGMFSAIATPEQLGFHPVYLALVIGCGSKPLSWMNDSGFWVIGKMSGMTEKETLKTFSAQTSIEGVAGLVICVVLSKVFPMV